MRFFTHFLRERKGKKFSNTKVVVIGKDSLALFDALMYLPGDFFLLSLCWQVL